MIVLKLNDGGFISIRNIGRERYCILRQEGFNDLKEWVGYFDAFWVSKLRKLEALLDSKEEHRQE